MQVSNQYFRLMGVHYPSKFSYQLAKSSFDTLKYQTLYDNIFDTVVIIMIIIAIFLIYTIQINDINQKLAQYTVLRVLGTNKFHLVLILILKGISFGRQIAPST